MHVIPELKAQSDLMQKAMKDMFQSLFGTAYIHQYFGLVMVLLSSIFALIFPYE